MGSILGDLPSFDPHNFSQLRPSDPSNPSKMTPITYHPTHDRTIPPPDQVISSEAKNILLRHFYMRAEEKLRPKRAASENLTPEHVRKHPRASTSEAPSDFSLILVRDKAFASTHADILINKYKCVCCKLIDYLFAGCHKLCCELS